MLSAVPNFFIDLSGHCDSSERKEHIIPEVIPEGVPEVQGHLHPSNLAPLMMANSGTLFPFLCRTSECWRSLPSTLRRWRSQQMWNILNFTDVKCFLVLLPHEHKCWLQMLTHSIRLVSYLLALRLVGCVLYTLSIAHVQIWKSWFFFQLYPSYIYLFLFCWIIFIKKWK